MRCMISLLGLNVISRRACEAARATCVRTRLRCFRVRSYVCDYMTVNHVTFTRVGEVGVLLPPGWDDRGRLVNVIRGEQVCQRNEGYDAFCDFLF